jgi:hypothetical protein
MPAIFNWDGAVTQAAKSSYERTTKGGTFKGAHNTVTYFPIAPIYSKLVPVVGYYKVPTNFADRPDLIANDLYKSTDLWWVIYWSNEIIDPFGRPASGEIIKIIDITYLMKLLNSLQNA